MENQIHKIASSAIAAKFDDDSIKELEDSLKNPVELE